MARRCGGLATTARPKRTLTKVPAVGVLRVTSKLNYGALLIDLSMCMKDMLEFGFHLFYLLSSPKVMVGFQTCASQLCVVVV